MGDIKERIIERTAEMFARDGLRSVRMDDIAAEMSISKRTIYEIFGDKDTLIMDCFRYMHSTIEAQTDMLLCKAENVMVAFLLILDIMDIQMDSKLRIMDDVKKFYPHLYNRIIEEHASVAIGKTRQMLQRGIDDGYLIPSIDIDLAIAIFMNMEYGNVKTANVTYSPITQKQACIFFMSHFIRGIATLKGVALIDEYFEKKLNK